MKHGNQPQLIEKNQMGSKAEAQPQLFEQERELPDNAQQTVDTRNQDLSILKQEAARQAEAAASWAAAYQQCYRTLQHYVNETRLRGIKIQRLTSRIQVLENMV